MGEVAGGVSPGWWGSESPQDVVIVVVVAVVVAAVVVVYAAVVAAKTGRYPGSFPEDSQKSRNAKSPKEGQLQVDEAGSRSALAGLSLRDVFARDVIALSSHAPPRCLPGAV